MTPQGVRLDEPFAVDVSRLGSTTSIAPSGELDAATRPQLQAAIPELGPGDRLILDLRRLAFMDSSGIRVVMTLDVRSRAEGWGLAIIRSPGAVQRVLDLCRVPERVRTVGDPVELESM